MSADPTIWLVARASGLGAYVVLTASVLAGLALTSRPFGRAVRGATVTELHRTLGLLALGFLALHGTALALDATVRLAPAALLVPGLSQYRPVATGIGVLASELLLVVHASFRFRKRLGIAAWRRLHRLAFVAFAGATVHGLAAGTDSGLPWALGLYLGATGAVVLAAAWRLLTVTPRGRSA